ncbi:hypothetical protein ACTJKJ_20485 [Roseateles sp. 22389]|uniref:hypothetical protein n=1 Tax=Roseateles sp. 22389 TaxID=3453916 RepID=UPI003F85CA05
MRSLGFESEAALVKAIIACAVRARRRDYRVELEVDAGVGVADVVLTKRAPRSTDALRAAALVSPRLAVLLSQGVGDAIKSRAELAAFLGTSEGAAQRVIAQLLAAGVAEQSRGALSISGFRTPPFERLIAVEAKLSDWQRVLVQAYRNLQFADESWVVLDHSFARPAIAQLDRFRVAGVGLASIERGRGLFIHQAAGSEGPMSPAKRWQAQAVLSSRVLTRKIASGAG